MKIPSFRSESVVPWQSRCLKAAACVLLLVGCDPQANLSGPQSASPDAAEFDQSRADFDVAMDFLDGFHQYDRQSASERIIYHLQRWAEQQQPDPDWFADPLFNRLPKRFDNMQGASVLSQLKFQQFDIMMLREAIWMRDLARQIRSREVADRHVARWLLEQEASAGPAAGADLETAFKIFDWVIRNVQQDRLDAEEDDAPGEVPPPGAKFLPGEALLLGHGDALVRARIAIYMARQLEIPMVMLGIDTEEGEPRPWCLAVLVDQQLHLLDTRWGLPIPDPNGEGIATLNQVLDHPEVLRRLDVPGGAGYPVRAADLKKVVALIDATPEYLSQRMKLVEAQLMAHRKLALTCSPSSLSLELRACRGITNVSLWSVPYDTYLFRQRLSAMPPYLVRMQMELQLVDGPTPLAQARRQHFRGVLSATDTEEGAKSYYLACRVPDADIEKIRDVESERLLGQTDEPPEDPAERARLLAQTREKRQAAEALKRILGWAGKLPEDSAARARLIARARESMQTAKQYASYWLGLIAFDERNYSVAANYLKKRTLDAYPEGPWTQGARYNLGRTYEQLAVQRDDPQLLDEARRLYLADRDSPQAAGNQIRADRLEPAAGP